MGLSMGHLLLLLVIVLVVFGAGKIPQIMGDVAKGLKAFKEGMKEGDKVANDAPISPQKGTTQGTTPAATTIIDHDA